MRNRVIFGIILLTALSGVLYFTLIKKKISQPNESAVILQPRYGTLQSVVTCTGTISPRNRLEVMPTVDGRIDEMVVSEGDTVAVGDILGWMSSSERAALIDAARIKGKKELSYWEDSYKQIPIISPIAGTIIVREVEPGQSVSTSTVIYVISDKLVVQASVDETDIGKIKKGQEVSFTLDSYQERSFNGSVSHISYESTTTNSVTMYAVKITPDTEDPILRSGMTATVLIRVDKKEKALILPADALSYKGSEPYVRLVDESADRGEKVKAVTLGIITDDMVEVLSGLSPEDKVLIKTAVAQNSSSNKKSEDEENSNPFMQQGPPSGSGPPPGAGGPPPGGGGGPQ